MKKYISIFFIAIIIIGISGCAQKNESSNPAETQSQNDNKSQPQDAKISATPIVPSSLDKYYGNNPSEYLTKMYGLSESMEAIVVNIDQGNNKTIIDNSINKFSEDYRNSSGMVPEWNDYYDLERLDRLTSNNYSQTLDVLNDINDACADCHREIKSAVWVKYYWKDFRDIKMDTINGTDSWISAKNKLEEGFDGIAINIRQGQKDKALDSFKLFKQMYNNMIDICGHCHTEKPDKFIDNKSLDILEKDIVGGNLSSVEKIRENIKNNCYSCHIIHETPQRIEELEEPR